MEIKRNSTSLFTNAFKGDKNANRKSLKLDDEKSIFSKFVESVRRTDSKKKVSAEISAEPPSSTNPTTNTSAVLDRTSLEKLDAFFAMKDDEEKSTIRAHVKVGSQRYSASKTQTISIGDSTVFIAEDNRELSKRDSQISLPSYSIRRAERKDTSSSDGPVKNNAVYDLQKLNRNKRANSDKSDLMGRKDELTPKQLERERQVAVSSRLPSTLLPLLTIAHQPKRHRHISPSSPTASPSTSPTTSPTSSPSLASLRPSRGPRPSKSNGDIPRALKAESGVTRMVGAVNNAGF